MDKSSRVGNHYEISLEARELYLAIAGLLLFMAFLFVCGVFVGKKIERNEAEKMQMATELIAPESVTTSVPAVEGSVSELISKQEPKSLSPMESGGTEEISGGEPTEGEVKYTYYDSLVKGKGVGIETPPEKKTGSSLPVGKEKAGAKPVLSGGKSSERLVEGEGKYTIQIASFLERDQAQNLVRWLRERGYPSFLVTAEIPDRGTWHRVRVGRFPTKEAAEIYQKELEKRIHLRGFVTHFD